MFSEQVVASHAVKVAVTEGLSSRVQGFLPVHCVHQLLKSRAFSKHRVHQVRDWIYRQVRAAGTPLHPVLPPLIEVYVNSILVPASNRGVQDQTNEPIPEADVRAIFAGGEDIFFLLREDCSHVPSMHFRQCQGLPSRRRFREQRQQ